MVRPYTRRNEQARIDLIMKKIARMDERHNDRIGKLREKAQRLQTKIDLKVQARKEAAQTPAETPAAETPEPVPTTTQEVQ